MMSTRKPGRTGRFPVWIVLGAVALWGLKHGQECLAQTRPADGASPAKAAQPAQTPKHPANRLARETSPYLLLHAHNPVDWYPWGPEAFERAKKENKPIFLSVGYSSCYWCHVMERESFEDPETARFLNEHFISIKVDREERPDVDQVYMTALQLIARGGGWPMSMFLTPDGRPFFGGTYFPPKDRDGLPAFKTVLLGVIEAWRDQRKEVDQAADALAAAVRATSDLAAQGQPVPLSRDMLIEGQRGLAVQFDPDFGGFGYDPDNAKRPKFPTPVNMLFLLYRHRRLAAKEPNPVARRLLTAKDPRLVGPDPLAMVRVTLDHMSRGGIRDHLAGGYHRYSTDRAWLVPHFEKMLYDNALLVPVFLEAFEATDDPRWRAEAEAILAFITKQMTSPEGAFFAALDAETEGEEGGYYVWTRAQVQEVLGNGEDEALFEKVYGLDREPSFEDDRYVLFLPRTTTSLAEALGLSAQELEARLVPLRSKLLEARAMRPAPLRDDKVLTAWNGLMIAAFADASRTLKNESYRQVAERAADFLLDHLRSPDGGLLRTYRAGQSRLPAYLDDYAYMAHGLLRLHAATGDPKRLDQARSIVDRMLKDFQDEENGGFFYTADDHESLLARPKDPYDGALPSGNAVAVRVLIALGKTTGEARYLDDAGRALKAFSPVLEKAPAEFPTLLLGLAEYLDARPEEAGDEKAGTENAPDPLGVGSRGVIQGTAALDPEEQARVVPGGTFDVTLDLTIKEGWHLYAHEPGAGNVIPTTVALDPATKGASLASVDYPDGMPVAMIDGEGKVSVYQSKVAIRAGVRLADDIEAGPRTLTFSIRHQACNDRACLAPSMLEVPVEVEVRPRSD